MESSDSLPFDSFKSKKILHSSAPKSSPSDQLTKACTDSSTCSSKTPEKPPNPPSRVRNRRTVASVEEMRDVASELPIPDQDRPYQYEQFGSDDVNLPEKYEILGKFFNSLDSSIRLLRLRRSVSTFTNIFPKVECLTDRRFSYGHLAQLKFILPDVIEIKKVLVHDERTCCMKPDLHVTMNVDAIKNEGMLKLACGNSHMRKVFHSRLLDFFKAHPELDDNIDLFFRARNNIAVILKDMREMPGIMRRMPPLPETLNEELANSILPRTSQQVLVVGGGDGGVLREISCHNSVI